MSANIFKSLLGLIYPMVCICCNKRIFSDHPICLSCELNLAKTNFYKYSENKVSKIFWGRTKIEEATSIYYLQPQSKIAHAIYALKYKGREDVGIALGQLMASELQHYPNFNNFAAIIPVPLTPKKMRIRGYNQCQKIAEGMLKNSLFKNIPIIENSIVRAKYEKSQTVLGRWHRYKNASGAFKVKDIENLCHKKVLVIDDVITTGGTLEAVCTALNEVDGIKIFVASVAYSESS